MPKALPTDAVCLQIKEQHCPGPGAGHWLAGGALSAEHKFPSQFSGGGTRGPGPSVLSAEPHKV